MHKERYRQFYWHNSIDITIAEKIKYEHREIEC